MRLAAPRSLLARLVLVQAAYGVLLALAFLGVLEFSHGRYHLEATQRQGLALAGETLARHRERFALVGAIPDLPSVRTLFEELARANPGTDYYLADVRGQILASSQPESRLGRTTLDAGALEALIRNPLALPVPLDDPAQPGVARAFSAVRIGAPGAPAGYLLLILRGQDTGTLFSGGGSRVFRESALLIAGISLPALGAALTILLVILRPLRRLSRTLELYRREGVASPAGDAEKWAREPELERLSRHLDHMACQTLELLHQMKSNDRGMREMFAGVSHDLRTPLTIVQGCLESLQVKGESLPAELRERLTGAAVAQTHALERLIRGVFDLARLQGADYRLQRETFSIAEMAQDVAMKFSVMAAERGVELKVDGGDRPLHVTADVHLVERVFDNLIGNALRHATGATEITIWLAQRGAGVEVTVSDNGPGLPAAASDSPAGGANAGHGLGLSIVRRILELHGTALVVLPGGGIAFRFVLPKAQGFGPPESSERDG